MKQDSIFASKLRQSFEHIQRERKDRLYPDGSSVYSKDTAVEFPCDPSISACVGQLWRVSGSLTAFLIHILSGFISQMPKLNEIGSAVNNSSRSSAYHETGTSYADFRLLCNNPYSIPTFEAFIAEACRRFDEECAAKNMAYYFIASMNLVERFMTFCREHADDDGHAGVWI